MSLYSTVVKKFCRVIFNFWQALGVHITPVHFYSPIPDTAALPKRLWQKQSALPGLDLRIAEQLVLLKQLAKFKKEYDALPRQGRLPEFYLQNHSFESVDAEVLYSMIRCHKPKRIWEIGSGMSTLLAAQALEKNRAEGHAGELVVFEPYPAKFLRMGFPGLTRLVQKPIQDIPVKEFQKLQAGDILFIDSSHVLKIGSDVQYEYLEILPRLNPGVMVHVHDIFWPGEYPEQWVKHEHRFWTEQYLFQAFLAFNRDFQILLSNHYLHVTQPAALRKAFASYNSKTVKPGSVWMVRVG
ncbi:class I SAM-dependent methyltransferase [Candidatus Falkowbacteria bacterium]|nr:class I SAM-dependent methyltransferase [Candidatus Falkowbacteria bacterium]